VAPVRTFELSHETTNVFRRGARQAAHDSGARRVLSKRTTGSVGRCVLAAELLEHDEAELVFDVVGRCCSSE
jgi:hypothetical protein